MSDAKPSVLRRYLPRRLSLRTFFLLVTILSVTIGLRVDRIRTEERAAAAYLKVGGKLTYRHQVEDREPRSGWFGKLAGDYDVVHARAERLYTDKLSVLDQLEHFTQLERLVVSGHDEVLTDDALSSLKSLHNLKSLRLGSFGITDAGLVHLSGLRRLEELEISPSVFMESFGAGGSSRGIGGASPGNIGGDGLANLKDLRRLRVLKLPNNQISDASLEHLSRLSLEELDLSCNPLDGSGIARMKASHETLRSIKLRGITVSPAGGIAAIKEVSALKQLDLTMSPNATSAAKVISDALPNCTIKSPARMTKAQLRQIYGPRRAAN